MKLLHQCFPLYHKWEFCPSCGHSRIPISTDPAVEIQTYVERDGWLYRVRAHLDFIVSSIAIHPFEIAPHRKGGTATPFHWHAAFRTCTLFPETPAADCNEAERYLQQWAARVIATGQHRSITDEDFAPEFKRWSAGDDRS